MRQLHYIRDAAALATLTEQLAGAARIALDTEFMRERTYYAKLCLVQLATPELLAVVDPLEISDLRPLWEVVTGGPEIVLHAAGQDLEIVAGLSGGVPQRYFDTQIAAAFVGYGDSIGYARLVDRVIGRTPGHSEAYTDWTRRPLSQDQIDYALDDVRYLLEITEKLESELREAGREAWVREELTAVLAGVRPESDPDDMWRKVRGARGLRGRKLAVMQEVAAWREREAQARDIPRQRVVADRVLAEIAKRAPRKPEQIERLRGLHPREASRSSKAILEAVRRGVERPESEVPDWGEQSPQVKDARVEMIAALLDAVLRGVAARMRLSSRLLANRRDLEALARYRLSGAPAPPDLPVLSGWRRESVGERLLQVVHGQLAVTIDDHESLGPQLRLRPTE